MYIKIGCMYINTTNIATITGYVKKLEQGTEYGIMINGTQYAIYSVTTHNIPKELHDEICDKCESLIKNIIQNPKNLKQLDIDPIDVSKYVVKEQIND